MGVAESADSVLEMAIGSACSGWSVLSMCVFLCARMLVVMLSNFDVCPSRICTARVPLEVGVQTKSFSASLDKMLLLSMSIDILRFSGMDAHTQSQEYWPM